MGAGLQPLNIGRGEPKRDRLCCSQRPTILVRFQGHGLVPPGSSNRDGQQTMTEVVAGARNHLDLQLANLLQVLLDDGARPFWPP